jgi:hypothetical protein
MIRIKEYDFHEKKESDDDFYVIGGNLNPNIMLPTVSWELKEIKGNPM